MTVEAALAEAADVVAWRFDNLSAAARDWAEAELTERLVSLLLDDSSAADVLQIAFGLFVKGRAISLAKRAARRSEPNIPEGLTPTDPTMTAGERASWQDAHDDRQRVVASLPGHLREPWELNKLHDIPVQSTDPDVTPLTERFGLSSTALYNRIRKADRLIRDALQFP